MKVIVVLLMVYLKYKNYTRVTTDISTHLPSQVKSLQTGSRVSNPEEQWMSFYTIDIIIIGRIPQPGVH
jgi:hypothetical protein